MKKGAVAFLDILGFKGIWQSRGADDVLSLLNSVPELVIQTYKQPPPEKNWPESSEPSITILSDTIVITIKSNEPHCILLLVDIINKILVLLDMGSTFSLEILILVLSLMMWLNGTKRLIGSELSQHPKQIISSIRFQQSHLA
jgi:hypothetical protein